MPKRIRVTIVKEFDIELENYRLVEWPIGTDLRDLTDPKEILEYEKYIFTKEEGVLIDLGFLGGEIELELVEEE